jgi:hypothetical protein
MKDLSGNSLISRILGRDADEDQTSIDPAEAFETLRPRKRSTPGLGGRPWDFAVELVVETIDDLPSNFPRESAIRIVRRTLSAAGIEIGDFNRRTWARIPQISSEIELARRRDKEFKEKTEEDIRSLEGEIRKAREAYESIHAKEEGEISRASKELENIKRVRGFFGFSDMEADENASASGEATEKRGPLYADSVHQGRVTFSSRRPVVNSTKVNGEENTGSRSEEGQVRDSLDAAWAQIEAVRAQMKRPFDPDAGADKPTRGPDEGTSTYSEPHNTRE